MATKRICSVDGCGKPYLALGYCREHWRKSRIYGDPLVSKAPPRRLPLAWILKNVNFVGDECLLWPFGRNNKGYGMVSVDGKRWLAHRYMCTLSHGSAPTPTAVALHTCGNGHLGCTNPNHLRWGTLSENHLDRYAHNRVVGWVETQPVTLPASAVKDLRSFLHELPKRKCTVNNCAEVHYAFGFCASHYSRWKLHGDPNAGMLAPGVAHRFLIDVVLAHKDGDTCVLWPYKRTPDGYAKMSSADGNSALVHRRACEARHGEPPTPLHQAAHTCGNGHKGCVNPLHLMWKTQSENMADKLIHGTHSRGEKCVNAKLKTENVLYIRRMKGVMKQRELAKMFGVSIHTIRNVQRRQDWAWLP